MKQTLCVRVDLTKAGERKNQEFLQMKKKIQEIITYKKGPYKTGLCLLGNTFGREIYLTDGSNDNPLTSQQQRNRDAEGRKQG